MPAVTNLAYPFFLQLAVVLVLCELLWLVVRRLGQVRVVAIMLAGFLLGPSVFGLIAPAWQHWLFPTTAKAGGISTYHPSVAVLFVVGQLGLVMYMFLVGTSFDTAIFRRHSRQAVTASAFGIVAPMILGAGVGAYMVVEGGFFPGRTHAWEAALFIAAAFAITAFPMLAWIVHDSGLARTRLGTVALACAATDDAVAWILLAGVVAATLGSVGTVLVALVGGVVFVTFMLTVGRRALRVLGRWADAKTASGTTMPVGPLVITLVVMLLGAWATDSIGVYSVFGAFIAGVAMPRGQFVVVLRERLEPVVAYVLLPMFFVYSGLNTKLSVIFDPQTLIMLVIVMILAFVSKGVAVGLGARVQGMNGKDAASLGVLMNARGLIEFILLNVGLTAGIIGTKIYTIFAIMAIVTTVAATPLYNAVQKHWKGPRAADEKEPEPEFALAGAATAPIKAAAPGPS